MSAELLDQLRNLWAKNLPPPPAIPPPPSPPVATALPAPADLQPAELQARLKELWRSRPATCVVQPICPPKTLPHQDRPACREQPVFIDLETRSAVDIEVGGRPYAADPTTKIMTVAALINQQVIVWTPLEATPLNAGRLWPPVIDAALPVTAYCGFDLPAPLRDAVEAGRAFCAHNAFGFDALVWRAAGLPEPVEWIDTLMLAHAAGLPGRLDDLGLRLFGVGKDQKGSQLVKAMSRRNSAGEFPLIRNKELVQITQYNVLDVILLAGVYAIVCDSGEPDVIAAHQAINDRGVAFDVELAGKLIQLERAAAEDLTESIDAVTGGDIKASDLRRRDFVLNWVCRRGVRLADLQKATVEQLLENGTSIDPAVRVVLEARLGVNRVTVSKLETAIAACGADGRLRDLLVYHGAHTGRWTGRGVQPQNLPRPSDHLGDVSLLLPHVDCFHDFKAALPGGVPVADAVSALIRPCFCAAPDNVLCIADFAGIEARGVAWCAGELRQLELFAAGADAYCDLATQIFGYDVTPSQKRERAVGKTAVLGCGYGMGPDKFAATCLKNGIDLAAANTSAKTVIEAYRDNYSAIAGCRVTGGTWREGGLWNDLERAARRAINGAGRTEAGKCVFYREGLDLIVQLPSGRRMFFRNARIARGDQDSGFYRAPILFDSPKQRNETTYSGKLTENVVSGICRDLLASAIVECERVGLRVVLHVHDELVVEVPAEQADAALQQLLVIMSTPPAWAAGFPIEVVGFSAERYFKSPPKGTKSLLARQGAIV